MATLIVDQLVRPVPGGIGTWVEAVARELHRDGQDSDFTLVYSRSKSVTPLPDWRGARKVFRLSHPYAQLAWDRGINRADSQRGLVHAFSLGGPLLPASGPACVVVHDMLFDSHPEFFPRRARAWHQARLRHVLSTNAHIVVPDVSTADALLRASVSAERVTVVAPGADHLEPPDREFAKHLLAMNGVRGEYIVSVGTLEPRKNLGRVTAAFRQFGAESYDPPALVVVGPRGWGASLDGGYHIVPIGRVDGPTLSGLIAGARAMVYAPLVEGYGLPPLEAMAHAVPVVISSTIPAARIGGIEVDPLSVDSIAKGMSVAVNDEKRRAEETTRGLMGIEGLTWKATTKALRDVWQSLT